MRELEGLVIAVDCDEVLGDFNAEFVKFHNQAFGTSFSPKDFFSQRYWEVLGISREECIQLVDEFQSSELFLDLPPVKGSKEGIKALAAGNSLVVVTSRSPFLRPITEQFLDKYYPGYFSELCMSSSEYRDDGGTLSKVEICAARRVNLIIEDSLDYGKDCAAAGIPVWLLDYPWNKSEKIDGITRFENWDEIISRVNTSRLVRSRITD